MKTKLHLLLLSLVALSTRGADFISLDDFKTKSIPERQKLIEQAPPEMKQKLIGMDNQLQMIAQYGGEEGWREHQEDRAIENRGLGAVKLFFVWRDSLNRHAVRVGLTPELIAEMSPQKQAVLEKQFREQDEALDRRYFHVIHPLLVGLAPSSQALQLARNADSVNKKWERELQLLDTVPPSKPAMTKRELDEINKVADEVLEKLKSLPQITPTQVEDEINALPEESSHR
jgi:hypothetical protein